MSQVTGFAAFLDIAVHWSRRLDQFFLRNDMTQGKFFILVVLILMPLIPEAYQVESAAVFTKSKFYGLAYGYNPGLNGSFAVNNVLKPENYIRGWNGWGVYLDKFCTIRLAQLKAEGFKSQVWIHGPGLKNSSAEDCFAKIADDGDFNLYYPDGTLACSVIQHPYALKGVSSSVGYELLFVKDSLEWWHHMSLELRHYNFKVKNVTLWQDLLSIIN